MGRIASGLWVNASIFSKNFCEFCPTAGKKRGYDLEELGEALFSYRLSFKNMTKCTTKSRKKSCLIFFAGGTSGECISNGNM